MPGSQTLCTKSGHSRRKNRMSMMRRRQLVGEMRGKQTRLETPLLRLKFVEEVRGEISERDDDQSEYDVTKSAISRRNERRRRKEVVAVNVSGSARKIGSGLWRLQLPVVDGGDCETMMIHSGVKGCGGDQLGFQPDVGPVGLQGLYHCNGRKSESDFDEFLKRPHSVSAHRNRFVFKLDPSFQISNSAMEGATKWDSVRTKTDDDIHQIGGYMMPNKEQVAGGSLVLVLEAELKQARARVHKLETEQTLSKKKLERFMGKLSEERSEWRRREHEKLHAYIENVKTELKREIKTRQRMEIINSNLVNELAEARSSAKQFMHGYEKERKDRKLMEQVCEELANDVREDKAQVEAMKRDCFNVREELEEERKMLQIAEVWREERVQMKLVDAKVALEEMYSQMMQLVADLEIFLVSQNATHDIKATREAKTLLQAASSINIQEITNFSYEPPNQDDFLSVFQDVNGGEVTKQAIGSRDEELEEDGSEWDTNSQLEDIDSSYATQNETDWEFDGDEDSRPSMHVKRSSCHNNGEQPHKIILLDGMNGRMSNGNGRISNASMRSQDRGSSKGNGRISNVSMFSQELGSNKAGLSPSGFVERWISSDAKNPNVAKTMKGCIELPRGALPSSLKAKLLEARKESKKVQLRQVLKQKA